MKAHTYKATIMGERYEGIVYADDEQGARLKVIRHYGEHFPILTDAGRSVKVWIGPRQHRVAKRGMVIGGRDST